MTIFIIKDGITVMAYHDVYTIIVGRSGECHVEYLINHKDNMSADWQTIDYDRVIIEK